MYTLLSSALCLGALLAYLAYVNLNAEMRTSKVQRSTFAFFFCLATALYLIALLIKAASVSLPIAAGAIDLFVLGRPIKKVIRSLGLWVLLGIPIVLLAKHFQDVSQIAAPAVWGRPWVALDAFGFYLGKMLVPIHLIPDYGRNPHWVMQHPLPATICVGIAIVALIVAWLSRKKFAWITAGIGLLLAGISPYLGLTTFDFQYVSTVADRYAYFGLIGLAVLVAGVAMRSRIASAGFLVVIAIMAGLTHQQVQRWHDTTTLFNYTLAVNDRSLISHNVFGFIAAREHRPADAESHYLAALQIWPEDATIQFNLGNLYRTSRPDLAIERYSLAVKYQPRMVVYRNNLAAEWAALGNDRQACDQWQQAIAIDPDYTDARNNLADMLMHQGLIEKAEVQYQQVLQYDPGNAMPDNDCYDWSTEVESEFHVDGDYAQLLGEIGLTDAESVFTDPRIHVWRSLPDRENAMLDFVRSDGRSVRLHVKRYPEPFHFMAKHEMLGYRLLQKAQIPVAPIIAHGNRANKDSFIILPDLTGYTPADKLIAQGFSFDRLLEVTADLAALLHSNRLHHRDLYLCHFMVKATDDSVDAKLIDMARVDRMNSVLTRRRWTIKDLGQFWYSTTGLPVTDSQRIQWLTRYCQQRKIKFDRFIGPVQRKSETIARHDKRLQLKQPGRNVSIGSTTDASNRKT